MIALFKSSVMAIWNNLAAKVELFLYLLLLI